MKTRAVAALAVMTIMPCLGDGPVSPPALHFATGLPGKQVHLQWNTDPGVRYHIEKSTELSPGNGGGGGGGWTKVAVVTATDTLSTWTDPIPTSTRAFYRVVQPQAEVFSIEEPVLSTTGGTIIVQGQCLPLGSFLDVSLDGQLFSSALVPSGPGQWTATFVGVTLPGGAVLSAAVTDGNGTTICPVDVDISITETGFATDAPPSSLPPAAPFPQAGTVLGSNLNTKFDTIATEVKGLAGPDRDCDDEDEDFGPPSSNAKVGGTKPSDPCRWDTGGCRQARTIQGNPLYNDKGGAVSNPIYASDKRLAPGRNGMPGEVSLEYDALTLVCPAGPPVTWTLSYRSMAEVSSGHGSGWDFAYNVFIEAASSTAPTVTIHDGAGRADVFRRAADGSYRADGFSRVGQFAGDVFTLTFANRGTWTFHALDTTTTSGKLESIADPNGNALTCAYDVSGKLTSVSSMFGQSVAIDWSGDRIASVTDHTGRSVSFSYFGAADPNGPEGDLSSIGCPVASGETASAGSTSFTYSAGTADPRLDHNLLSVTDGAGRVLESFTYASTTTHTDLDFDSVATHSAHELGHNLGMCHDHDSTGRRVVYENDELGRVTETVFDRKHRVLLHRIHNGFHTAPGGTVSVSDFPLSGKTRSMDPDYYETTRTYNADSNITAVTATDGSQMLTTYERDLNSACSPIERGNARVQTLVSSLGEKRSITIEYLPNSGTPESARPGGPIRGMTVKGGRNPSPDIKPGYSTRRRVEVLKSNKQGDPDANKERGITINTSHVEYETAKRLIWSPRSNIDGPDDDCDGVSALLAAFLSKKGYDYYQAQSRLGGGRKGWDGTVKGSTSTRTGPDNDCDGLIVAWASKKSYDSYQAQGALRQRHLQTQMDENELAQVEARITRITTSHGQVFTWTYDAAGNCTSSERPVSGGGAVYVHDGQGRLTSVTQSNGAAGDFHDEFTYGSDGFLHACTQDPSGRNLTTTYEYDSLGRCTRIVDPMSADWLLTWNALDVCTQTQSPPVAGERIATDFTYDSAGLLARCDVEHRDAFGNLDSTNPAYSTFWVRDFRGRLSEIATEERPTDNTGLLEPDPLTIENFAVTHYTYDDAGQVVRLTTPAACRAQLVDRDCDFQYDERGMLHRCIDGGTGDPASVITEYDYDTLGTCVREARIATDGGETLYAYDAFHRPASITDAMGNETVFTYDEAGRVTTSFYGETEDLPGNAGNILLSSTTENLGNNQNWAFGGGTAILRRTHWAQNLSATYEESLDSARESGGRENTSSSEWIIGATRHYAHVDCPSRAAAAFFSVYQEDDTIEVERFGPTDSPPFAKETTVIDRSPAGLVMNVTRNGDLLDSFTYDSSGALSSISNAARTITCSRDACNNAIQCGKTEHFRVASPPAPKSYTHTITRDSLGRITAVTDGAGNASAIAYDSLGRCTSLANPGRPPVTFAYDGGDATGPYSAVAACDIDNTGASTELGRYVMRCGVPVSFTDSNGYTTTLTRDALDRVTRCDLPDGTFATTTYDARGLISGMTHIDGSTTSCVKDRLGRTIGVTPVNDPPSIIPSPPTTYAYDGLGRLVSASQGPSLVTMTWDSVGNPLSETSNGLTVSRTFNHRGRTSVTYPDATTIPETRDEFGQLTNVGGNLIRYVGHSVYQTEQTNGVTTTYTYRGEGDSSPPGDASYGSCVRVTATSGTTTLADTLIERAPDQRVLISNGRFTDEATGPARIRTYTYDGLGRIVDSLTEVRETLGGPITTESDVHYTLDAAGRRLSVTGGSHPGSYTQDATIPPGDHQMGQYTTWPGGNIEWDDLGNLSHLDRDLDALDLDSDSDGRLAAVNDSSSGNPLVTFTYDALGRLSSRTEHDNVNGLPPVTTSFVWDGACIAQELDDPNGTGELSAALTFVSDDGGIKHCISTRNGTLYYPISSQTRQAPCNNRGVCEIGIGITSDTGAVLERYDLDEAGELLLLDDLGTPKSAAIGPIRWMAPEAMRDSVTGLLHGHGWTYSPPLGEKVTAEKFHVTETFGQTTATRSEK